MTKGVNYPKGLLAWADEIGIENVLNNWKTYKLNMEKIDTDLPHY